jgi:hypothetical protein
VRLLALQAARLWVVARLLAALLRLVKVQQREPQQAQAQPLDLALLRELQQALQAQA